MGTGAARLSTSQHLACSHHTEGVRAALQHAACSNCQAPTCLGALQQPSPGRATSKSQQPAACRQTLQNNAFQTMVSTAHLCGCPPSAWALYSRHLMTQH